MAESKPLLGLGAPIVGVREKQSRNPPRPLGPGANRQGRRLSPKFAELQRALEQGNVDGQDSPIESDPELVVVFELAGSVDRFCNAVRNIPGLEFLAELAEEDAQADEDFFVPGKDDTPSEKPVRETLQLVMANAEAARQLVQLFNSWVDDPKASLAKGLGPFKQLFNVLRDVRKWGPEDRIQDTGLISDWKDQLEMVGQAASNVAVEIELWFRDSTTARQTSEAQVTALVEDAGGSITDRSEIPEISYHALLVNLPIQQVEAVLADGPEAIHLLTAGEVMFVSPHRPMSVSTLSEDIGPLDASLFGAISDELPRIALLDGLPIANHDLLAGRVLVDDPDEFENGYPATSRRHGTAMASLITLGDLSASPSALDRKIYVRPIMRPHPINPAAEQVPFEMLFTDLLHRSIRRIFEGDERQEPLAPSVRIVNLSVCTEARAFVRTMSPAGRLLDWLAHKFNVLVIVSAGNHHKLRLRIEADDAKDPSAARAAAHKAATANSILRGVLPPADSINALSVGAIHDDSSGAELPDGVWDVTERGLPAHYGATGPGFNRSVKPEISHAAGMSVYERPIVNAGEPEVALNLLASRASGPGQRVASPGATGASSATSFTYGTSNAAALVTRAASSVFDVLEAGPANEDEFAFPSSEFHPAVAKALLVHASSWGESKEQLRQLLTTEDTTEERKLLTKLLGYGTLDIERLGYASSNRAVLIAGNSIGSDESHTHQIPLPSSLNAKADGHRFTVTLAYLAPTVNHLTRYRIGNVYFESLDESKAGGAKRTEAWHQDVRRGTCQHEIIEGNKAMAISAGDTLPITVCCMDDARHLKKNERIRYGLAVSIETRAAVSLTIHEEVRAQLRQTVRARPTVRAR